MRQDPFQGQSAAGGQRSGFRFSPRLLILLLFGLLYSFFTPTWNALKNPEWWTKSGRRKGVYLAVGLLAFGITWWVWGCTFKPIPVIHDEDAYLLQAEIFASGHLNAPARPDPEMFKQWHVFGEPRVVAKYSPGHALALAPGMWIGMPALDALDTTEHRLLLAGFPLQTLGAISGAAFLSDLHLSQGQLLQVILAYGTWVLIAAVLLLRAILGWHGRRTAYGTVAGAACVMLVLFLYIVRGTGA